MNRYWFDYKTVIITGASAGMGKALTLKLVKNHGCRVIAIARSRDKLEALKKELHPFEHKLSYYTFDVSDKERWQQLAKELTQQNIKADILINNAGILPRFDRFDNYTDEEILLAMQTNFYSCLYSIKALLPVISASENGAIINISSSAALCSLAGTCIYSASKAALRSYTDAIREELRGRLYVGLVCPGFTKTDIFRNQRGSSQKSLRAMDLISTDCDRMVDKILRGIARKRELMILGADAHIMDTGNRLFGTKCSALCSKVMEVSGLEMFEGVFG